MRIVMLTALAACSLPTKHLVAGDAQGGDSGVAIDAPADAAEAVRDAAAGDGPAQFACIGHEYATTAPASIVLTGTVRDALNNQPVAAVPVQGVRTDSNSSFLTATTDTTGTFTRSVQTGSVPIPGKLVVGGPGVPTVIEQVFPSRPFDGNTSLSITTITSAELQQLYAYAGVAYDGTQATVLATIVDCTGAPLQAARLTADAVTPNGPFAAGHIYYFHAGLPDTNATETDATGRALVLGMPAANATFSATRAGVSQFLSYQIVVSGGEIYELAIQP